MARISCAIGRVALVLVLLGAICSARRPSCGDVTTVKGRWKSALPQDKEFFGKSGHWIGHPKNLKPCQGHLTADKKFSPTNARSGAVTPECLPRVAEWAEKGGYTSTAALLEQFAEHDVRLLVALGDSTMNHFFLALRASTSHLLAARRKFVEKHGANASDVNVRRFQLELINQRRLANRVRSVGGVRSTLLKLMGNLKGGEGGTVIVYFNYGLHYLTHNGTVAKASVRKERRAYKTDVAATISMLRKLSLSPPNNLRSRNVRVVPIVRSTYVQHFPTDDNTGLFESFDRSLWRDVRDVCIQQKVVNTWRDMVLKNYAMENCLPYVDLSPALASRSDLVKGGYRMDTKKWTSDCTHLCGSEIAYVPEIYGLCSAFVKEMRKKTAAQDSEEIL